MRIPETFGCDLCQKQRHSDSNHWLQAHRVSSGGILIMPWDAEHWDESANQVLDYRNADAHLCGQDHALQWMSQQLSKPVLKEEVAEVGTK